MNVPDLRDLQYFAAIVEHGSLTRASQALKVSQPTLTHAVGRIEQALGGAIWQRLKNRRAGVLPTELGRRALERGRRAALELDALSQDAALLRGLEAGVLRIGTIQSLAATLLPRWVARFSSRHAGVALDFPFVTSAEADALVREGKLDAALVVGAAAAEGLTAMRCGEQALVLVARADHALARRAEVALAALAGDPFVLVPSGTFAAVDLDALFRRAGFAPGVRARLSSISGLCALVRAGVGVTILPEGSVPRFDRELVELSLRPAPRRPVRLLYRRGATPSPALTAWLTVGAEVVAELPSA